MKSTVTPFHCNLIRHPQLFFLVTLHTLRLDLHIKGLTFVAQVTIICYIL